MTNNDDGRFGPTSGEAVFASPQITTEELLNMRVVPEQRAELAALQEALGTNPGPRLTSTNQTLDGEAALADIRLCLASYGFIAANQAEFLLAEVARLSAAPLLVSADSTQAERINAERREREALIGRLRAELADERTLSARYAAEVGRLCAELVDAEAQRVEMTTQRDLWRHMAAAWDATERGATA